MYLSGFAVLFCALVTPPPLLHSPDHRHAGQQAQDRHAAQRFTPNSGIVCPFFIRGVI
jgi:hypothetical protein